MTMCLHDCSKIKKAYKNFLVAMGNYSEVFKAAQTGNTILLEKVFVDHLKRVSRRGHYTDLER